MRPSAARFVALLLIVAVAGGLGGGCRKSKKKAAPPTTASTAPPVTGRQNVAGVPAPVIPGAVGACLDVPTAEQAAQANVKPHPAFPPVPEGTRWVETAHPQPGQTINVAAVPETVAQFQQRIKGVWFPAGWREIGGEVEPDREVEGVFQREDIRIGIRARVLYCDTKWVELRMIVNR